MSFKLIKYFYITFEKGLVSFTGRFFISKKFRFFSPSSIKKQIYLYKL